jgi:hypothetical protein
MKPCSSKLYTDTLMDHALVADVHSQLGRLDPVGLQDLLVDALLTTRLLAGC